MANAAKILITGASGLVGKAVLDLLSSQGHFIRALVFEDSKIDTTFQNVEWQVLDILDVTLLQEAMKGISQVYHCLDYTSFLESDSNNIFDINVKGTENVVNLCIANNVKKIVYLSNIQSFGTYAHKNEITENTKWIEHKNNTFYGICKNRAELEIWRGKEEGLETIIVNPSLILAPKSDKIYNLKNIAEANYKFQFEGENGFVALEDVAKICTQLMHSNFSGKQYILNAENLSYDFVYNLLASSKKKNKAFSRMTSTKANIISKINGVRNMLLGSRPFLSNDILNMNAKKFNYSNSRIVEALDYHFISIADYVKKLN